MVDYLRWIVGFIFLRVTSYDELLFYFTILVSQHLQIITYGRFGLSYYHFFILIPQTEKNL